MSWSVMTWTAASEKRSVECVPFFEKSVTITSPASSDCGEKCGENTTNEGLPQGHLSMRVGAANAEERARRDVWLVEARTNCHGNRGNRSKSSPDQKKVENTVAGPEVDPRACIGTGIGHSIRSVDRDRVHDVI